MSDLFVQKVVKLSRNSERKERKQIACKVWRIKHIQNIFRTDKSQCTNTYIYFRLYEKLSEFDQAAAAYTEFINETERLGASLPSLHHDVTV